MGPLKLYMGCGDGVLGGRGLHSDPGLNFCVRACGGMFRSGLSLQNSLPILHDSRLCRVQIFLARSQGFRLRHCLLWWHFFTMRNIKMRTSWVSAAAVQVWGIRGDGGCNGSGVGDRLTGRI